MRHLQVQGTGLRIPARDGETILATLHRAGFALRVGCRRGGCGICTVDITAGRVEYPVTVCEQALPAADRARGVALACRAVPAGDVEIAVAPESKLRCIAPMLTSLALTTSEPQATSDGGTPSSTALGRAGGSRPETRAMKTEFNRQDKRE